jgi:hypothetical protein
MKMNFLNKKYIVLWTFLLIMIYFVAYRWIETSYASILKEGFDPNALLYGETNDPRFTKTVNMPITSQYICKNKCSPKARCIITGEQCSSDRDCYGCQPNIPPPPEYLTTLEVKPSDAAGKTVYNINPRYSELTTDLGTMSDLINPGSKVPKLYMGVDEWTTSANIAQKEFMRKQNEQQQLFEDKITFVYGAAPVQFRSLPKYTPTDSITGIFTDYGPPGSNSYITN